MKRRDGRGRFSGNEHDRADYQAPSTEDADIVKVGRKRWLQGEKADDAQRKREIDALRFYSGDQWPQAIKDSRAGQDAAGGLPATPARPCLTINKTREPVRQVLNQERQSDMGIELVPADDFGGTEQEQITHEEIEIREGLTRRIQRDSEAADARTWAFARAVIAGRGYYGVMTRYLPGKTADQEIFLQRFFNQACVMLDPNHEQPDGSDATWGIIGSDLRYDAYIAEYGQVAGRKNRACCGKDEWRALGDEAPGWFSGEDGDTDTRTVRVVDYYYTTFEPRELAMFKEGGCEWVDEMPEGLDPKGHDIRTVVVKKVKWVKIDGYQVLDKTDWAGKYIPIVKVVAEELQPFDSERIVEGMVTSMIDPCRGNNYMISKWVEMVGLSPIPPWMMAAGQDEGFEAEYEAANTRAMPVLHYNQKDLDQNPAPPPTRTNVTTDISAVAASVQMFNEAIVSTSGVPETALGQVDPSVKSGKLAKALIEQSNRGTSNYLDNLRRSIRHEARIINDLLYPIYGREGRIVRMMDAKGEVSPAMLHHPFLLQGAGKQARAVPAQPGQEGSKTYTLTEHADWNVAVKISKDFDTRREQEAETLGQIIEADPTQMAVIGDLFFKYQDGPGHEEMSERYKMMLAPPIQAMLAGKNQIPPEVQQQMQQAQEQMGQMNEELHKANEIIKGKQIEAEGKLKQTALEGDIEGNKLKLELASKEKIALIQATASMQNAQAKIDAEDARTFVDAMQAKLGKALELHLEQLGHMKDHIMQARDHQHEKEMAESAHVNAIDAATHQAAITPAPANGASA